MNSLRIEQIVTENGIMTYTDIRRDLAIETNDVVLTRRLREAVNSGNLLKIVVQERFRVHSFYAHPNVSGSKILGLTVALRSENDIIWLDVSEGNQLSRKFRTQRYNLLYCKNDSMKLMKGALSIAKRIGLRGKNADQFAWKLTALLWVYAHKVISVVAEA